MPFSNISFTELILSNDLLNYFYLQQYLDELVTSDFLRNVEYNGKEMITITDKGSNILEMFSSRISDEKKVFVDECLKAILDKLKKEITVHADYTIDEKNTFVVELNAYENGSPLIDLKMSVGSKNQALDLCKKWRSNSAEIYEKIITLFMD